MIRQSTSQLLSDMLEPAERPRDIHASKGPANLADSPKTLDPVLHNFIVIGEIANRLGVPLHEQHPEIPRVAIIGQRNVVARGYDIVDFRSLTETVEQDISQLIRAITQVIKQYPPTAEPRPESHP
jgi:uncharacterized protein with HEPN domain